MEDIISSSSIEIVAALATAKFVVTLSHIKFDVAGAATQNIVSSSTRELIRTMASMDRVALLMAADVFIKACPFDQIRARISMNGLAGLRH